MLAAFNFMCESTAHVVQK